MSALRSLALAAIAMLVGMPAFAEPVSIRCDVRESNQAYMLTFDMDAKLVMYESTTTNLHPGRIVSTDNGIVSFLLKTDIGGEMPAQWWPAYNKVTWPGFHHDAIRPLRDQTCMRTEARTVLAALRDPGVFSIAVARPYSLRCASEPFPSYFTFDRDTKLAVMESMSGQLYRGEIHEADADHIRFSVFVGGSPPFLTTWDRAAGSITIEGIPDDVSRPTKVIVCSEVAPRSIVELARAPH